MNNYITEVRLTHADLSSIAPMLGNLQEVELMVQLPVT